MNVPIPTHCKVHTCLFISPQEENECLTVRWIDNYCRLGCALFRSHTCWIPIDFFPLSTSNYHTQVQIPTLHTNVLYDLYMHGPARSIMYA